VGLQPIFRVERVVGIVWRHFSIAIKSATMSRDR
jgi:hypothetical protein